MKNVHESCRVDARDSTRREPSGALRLWREEIRLGRRRADIIDALTAAAACEANGIEARAAGLASAASAWFDAADALVVRRVGVAT